MVSQHALRQSTPPVNRITDSCKNITFPQLRLRAVKREIQWRIYIIKFRSKFFQFHAVFGKFWQKLYVGAPHKGWRPYLREILDLPLKYFLENCNVSGSNAVRYFSDTFWKQRVLISALLTRSSVCTVIIVRNEVAKVIFLHVSVILFTGGVCYPSMPCSRGVPALGGVPAQWGCLLPDGVCSRGCLLWGGGFAPGGWRPPQSRQLLLWTVRILLECILVMFG